MHVILDIETDDLQATKLWVIVCQDVETGVQYTFTDPVGDPAFLEFWKSVRKAIGHNIVQFDWPVLRQFFPALREPVDGLYDTLVVSRLLKWEIDGGHSLAAWGARLKEPKAEFSDFSHLSPEMVQYCQQDVRVTARLYDFQKKYWSSPRWQEAIATETRAARICHDLSTTGFGFNRDNAVALHHDLVHKRGELDREILSAPEFGPLRKLVRNLVPRSTKHGTINATDFKTLVAAGYAPEDIIAGRSYDIYREVPFNPGSPKQMVERLNSFGWKPFEKTKTHIEEARKWGREKDKDRLKYFETYGWKVSEQNLRTLPDTAPPAARLLAPRLIVNARISDLEEWLALVQPDGRVHGSFLPIGSWTGRMAHQKPNTANIGKEYADQDEYTPVEKLKKEYDGQLRALWGVSPDHWQIGVDMESAHLRVLAHLMNDAVFTASVTSGNKKDGTDTHSLNRRALGDICKSRDVSKTFIYAFINGAGASKIASVLDCSKSEAKAALEQFVAAFPGLERLFKIDIPKNAARGYFEGIDGRYVACDFEHGQLSGLLQNAEAIILKRTAWVARAKCLELGYPIRLLNLVHDEIQIELMKDDEGLAHEIGRMFADEYRLSAEHYRLRCPFAGGISVGKNWSASH